MKLKKKILEKMEFLKNFLKKNLSKKNFLMQSKFIEIFFFCIYKIIF